MSQPTFDPNKFISDEPVNESDRETLNRALDRTKVGLFYQKNSGFLSSLVATIDFDWDRTIPTACTNGVFMAWNPEFFLSLSSKSRVTVLAHEAWHIAFQHMGRRGDKDAQDWNTAADFVINNMLKNAGYDMSGFPFLLDPQYDNMTTEEVYNKVHTNRPKMFNPQDGDFSEPGHGPASIQKGMTPEQIAKKAMGNIMDAATIAKMNKQMGDLPGEIQQMIDDFLNPKLPWQEILVNFFESLSSVEFSYRSPNRRYQDPLLPGRTGRNGLEHLIYYLDVSGSISDADIVRFNSEVKYIKETYNPERLTLVMFDTKIHDVYEFEEDDEFEKVVITGRGGTCLRDVMAHAEKHQPTAIVIFTDLHVNIPQKVPSMPVIWAVAGNKNARVPYGTLIHIDE